MRTKNLQSRTEVFSSVPGHDLPHPQNPGGLHLELRISRLNPYSMQGKSVRGSLPNGAVHSDVGEYDILRPGLNAQGAGWHGLGRGVDNSQEGALAKVATLLSRLEQQDHD